MTRFIDLDMALALHQGSLAKYGGMTGIRVATGEAGKAAIAAFFRSYFEPT